MGVFRRSSWLLLLLGISLLATTLQGVQGEVEPEGPSESECRPFIEKALKELETGEPGTIPDNDSREDDDTTEVTTDDSDHQEVEGDDDKLDDGTDNNETHEEDDTPENDDDDVQSEQKEEEDTHEDTDENQEEKDISHETGSNVSSPDDDTKEVDETVENKSGEESIEVAPEDHSEEKHETVDDNESTKEESEETAEQAETDTEETEKHDDDSAEADDSKATKEESIENQEETTEVQGSEEQKDDDTAEAKDESTEQDDTKSASKEDEKDDSQEDTQDGSSKSGEVSDAKSEEASAETASAGDVDRESSGEDGGASVEAASTGSQEDKTTEGSENQSVETATETEESVEEKTESTEEEDGDSAPEEELSFDIEIPTELRDRSYVEHLLKLDEEALETEQIINRVAEITLKELKKLYENAIKPLEGLYKYRDLSNRHFGDAEIFSKPLILFMGPWSGGKSSIINYLLNNEYNSTSLRTGAEPSPAYFNILMHGDESEIWDGAQLAADFTFSGLQKFGQGLEERLRGVRLPSKLLEKVNIVEIPGILEVRKQVSRVFPFNDACQWFIDRADIIFLVYDPSKLDVGPETEAILDQLKGREHQTRIILNKADQVKPEELMRVQGALIWNISPLMSSPQPPIMYTTSLWSKPYEPWAPMRLLQAQERAFLRDLRSAVDKRIENKIASARRFAVRVRNHAKMVDCYLTTYYNHKSVFGNRKQVADEITEHPQDYHIYEGLSTLTNISRYDLPDPDVYRDFFKLNPLYEFQQLSATCTYFRGCPINRLDIAIAYDLPELIGKHKRLVESALTEANGTPVPSS